MAESSLKTLEKACGRNIAESLYNKVSKKVFLSKEALQKIIQKINVETFHKHSLQNLRQESD